MFGLLNIQRLALRFELRVEGDEVRTSVSSLRAWQRMGVDGSGSLDYTDESVSTFVFTSHGVLAQMAICFLKSSGTRVAGH